MDIEIGEMTLELDAEELKDAVILFIQDQDLVNEIDNCDFEMEMADVTLTRATCKIILRKKF
jgi:hypothetical protein